MPAKVRYGVIGCGMMGQEHLRNIALLPDTEVTVIFEPDAGMAEAAARFAPLARFANSVSELLEVDELDCILIASPNHCHVPQMEEIRRKRPLPLLVEKPLFTDPKDVAELEAFKASYPAPVWVAMEYRYMPPIAALIEQAETATGGIKMLTIREHRFPFLDKVGAWNRFNRYSGGTFVEKCCHFFDLMRLIMQCEPVRVMASAGQDANHKDEVYNGEQPDILDNGYVIVDFENGARAMLELCMFAEGSRYQEEVSAVGPDGKIEAFVPGPGRFWPENLGEPPVPQLVVSPRYPKGPRQIDIPVDPMILDAGDHNGSTFYQHEGFVAVVRGEKPAPEVTLEDGWRAVEMGLAAQQSARTGQAVTLRSQALSSVAC
ncbi:Putative oxidoreductase YteT precursor [Labrenzia sp. THAF191b]|uniref:Gfo/Idh/MocA family protein n=1 Tax=unclassified Labrenzia TaxID=2648686 RepID=UPI0012693917|nr:MULTISPECIES: Gfo/Idh/MocA family oxidoreductase [unclassified Labrenzia]QFT00669.1 Putative oxidoreductase YteT precursor [Labrenzia sp. THAF191b]QFT06982.1 Putative oxidoreductase YteT precursor [Labrenzia sp. THAF191a]QFT18526.1 Putative oxidoreductase YteT precursor [Labrenzia sp. THAF187b]